MTLIIAANLSDRIYMASDTRLSRKNSSGGSDLVTDNILKTIPVGSKQRVLVSCAGNITLVNYLLERLAQNPLLFIEIDDLRASVEERVRKLLGEYLLETGVRYEDAVCALIFAGTNTDKKHTLESSRLHEQVKYCQDLHRAKLDRHSMDAVRSSNEAAISFVEDMTSFNMSMKPLILQGLKDTAKAKDGNVATFEVDIPQHKLFVVDVNANPKNPYEVVKVTDVEWGEYVIRGSKHDKEKLSENTMCLLDFNNTSGDIFKDSYPLMAFVYSNYSPVIGGSITIHTLLNGHIELPTGKTSVVDKSNPKNKRDVTHTRVNNNALEHYLNDSWQRLIRVIDYDSTQPKRTMWL